MTAHLWHPGTLAGTSPVGTAATLAAGEPAPALPHRPAAHATLYDRVLTLQAEAQWRKDLEVLTRSPEWLAATTVLDLGAGNGEFGRRLAARFPLKSFIALEPDAELHAIGARAPRPANYVYLRGGFDPALEGFYDVLLARGVLMYMPERRALCDWAATHCGAALVMNNCRDACALRPRLARYAELRSRPAWRHAADQRAVERDRELGDTAALFTAAGFTLTGSTTAVTELTGTRGRLLAHHFLRAAVETTDPEAISVELLDELFEWSERDDACLTLGATWYRFRNTFGRFGAL